jgi:hypothetical protein
MGLEMPPGANEEQTSGLGTLDLQHISRVNDRELELEKMVRVRSGYFAPSPVETQSALNFT